MMEISLILKNRLIIVLFALNTAHLMKDAKGRHLSAIGES
jgi:hypothetical protein